MTLNQFGNLETTRLNCLEELQKKKKIIVIKKKKTLKGKHVHTWFNGFHLRIIGGYILKLHPLNYKL